MSESLLINEYGAGLTPLIEDLDAKTRPLLNQLHDWAMAIPEMNGHDWAIVRTYIMAGFDNDIIYGIPITNDGHWFTWTTIAHKFARDIANVIDQWVYGKSFTYDWEYHFIGQWVHGDLSCMCAQIQIEKAMQQRKAKENKS